MCQNNPAGLGRSILRTETLAVIFFHICEVRTRDASAEHDLCQSAHCSLSHPVVLFVGWLNTLQRHCNCISKDADSEGLNS